MSAAATAAAAIGVLGWIWPTLYDGGHGTVRDALSGSLALQGLLLVCFARFFITAVSYGTGAPGGIFAPVIALGTLVGVWFGDVTGHLIPTLAGHPHAFVIAGMGARSRRLMAGRDVRAFTPLP